MSPERRLKPRPATGSSLSKNVMVPMRDGVRLAFDIYRPARDGDFVEGRFPTIMLHTPYDKTDKRYSEIADFFVPKGYNVVLIDLRDRYCSEASGVYYHAATPHTGRDGYDICEWIADAAVVERPDRHRRQLLRRDHPGAHGARGAAAPDRDLARRRADEQLPEPVPRGRRDAAAHVLGPLHPRAGRAGRARRLEQGGRGVGRPRRTCGSSTARRRGQRGQTSLRHVPPLEDSLLDYYTRGAYDEYWDRIEHNYTRYWDQHADIPGTFSTGWYDPFPAADSEYFAAMAEKNDAPAAARDRPVEPRRHARRRDVLPRGRLRPPERLGRAALLRGAARLLQPLASRRRARPAAGRGAGADLRDGRRLRPQDGRRQARPRRALARGAGVAARAGRR